VRITIWSPNYAPEYMGIPPLVTDAATWLADAGHQVTVSTALPNYPHRVIFEGYRGSLGMTERRDGVLVRRSWVRARPAESFRDKALYELTFAAFSLPGVVKNLRQTDVLVCVVPSLMAASCAAMLAGFARRRRHTFRYVIWIQDLVLLAAESLDTVSGAKKRLLRSAGRIERKALQGADRIVVCSPGFQEYVCDAGVDSRLVTVVPNWVNIDEYAMSPPRNTSRPTRFLYAGNLGYTQGLETLIEAARDLGPEVEVEIVGDGNAAGTIRALAESLPNVAVRHSVPREESARLLSLADVLVLTQRGVSAGVNFPSKIGPYLASGRPVLAAIGSDTPAASVLRESQGAVVVGPENPRALAQAMHQLHVDPALRAELGERARLYAVDNLSMNVCLRHLEFAFLGEQASPSEDFVDESMAMVQ
jgi:putative colanic acid biosynthesis glycosyltransferase WcaI